ncbi:MAG: Cys-Xaa-Xaa-Xaa repeat radical SAM target protein [Alistipes sp.]|nr:Cys-Xaa-Xaa-Xaa repeat radical SAM target protein [Alistipes sp.]
MKKRNEEIQSRRDFFKRAAKAVLPIVAISAMASNPVIAKASEAMSCNGNCSGTCRSGCNTTCYTNCYNACKTTCKGACSRVTKY